MSGLERIADGILAELEERLPRQRKTQRGKLSVLIATMLDVRSANLMDLAAGLPRETERIDMRYQWIVRFLSNPLVVNDHIIEPFAREVLDRTAKERPCITLIIDQSKISDHHQVLMLAVRHGERALPLAWRVEQTVGGIGFAVQKTLLETVVSWMPSQTRVMLMGDRFYGTPDLLSWCQDHDWGYRLRVKKNLLVFDGDECRTAGGCAQKKRFHMEDIRLTGKRIATNIGIIHDPGHKEPWMIAMSDAPGYLRTLEYSERWGIEPMFSDFKSRGFGIEDSQIRHPDRLERLILVMALALYFAVSTGHWDALNAPTPVEKKRRPSNQKR